MDLHGSSSYATRRVRVALLSDCDELRPAMSRSNAFFDAHVNHDLRLIGGLSQLTCPSPNLTSASTETT